MKWKEIARRVNGFTLGPFGAQWTAKPSDAEIARRIIRFLEDRRVLYNHYAWELPKYCVESVLEIRRFLTAEITNLQDGSDLLGPVRVMRAACRQFLNAVPNDGRQRGSLRHPASLFLFYCALGEFRGAIGPQVALLATHYKIDVESDLARTLPAEDTEEQIEEPSTSDES